jgi:rubrerythrin
MTGRRYVIVGGVATAASILLARARSAALAQAAYLKTTEILRRARSSEVDAYGQYAAFTRQAKSDGYPGIAYLFAALATSELIHGQNFERILARLGTEIPLPVQRQVGVGSTQQNLIKAATDEIDSVFAFYPGLLKQLKPEGLQDAITMTTYAWESEKQHLDILKSIQQWTPNHFEAVAKKIENETGQYFVCQICGATAVKIPLGKCPICKFPSENFRRIEPPV